MRHVALKDCKRDGRALSSQPVVLQSADHRRGVNKATVLREEAPDRQLGVDARFEPSEEFQYQAVAIGNYRVPLRRLQKRGLQGVVRSIQQTIELLGGPGVEDITAVKAIAIRQPMQKGRE